MKKLVLVLVLMLASISLQAKDIAYTACTADNKVTVLNIVLNDQNLKSNPSAEKAIGYVFVSVAKGLSAAQLTGHEGYVAFITSLAEPDREVIDHLTGPPLIIEGMSCKP